MDSRILKTACVCNTYLEMGECILVLIVHILICSMSILIKRLPGPTCNGVDIFGVKTLEELTQELSKSIPLCEYCDAKHRMDGIPWKISEKKICEWALDER